MPSIKAIRGRILDRRRPKPKTFGDWARSINLDAVTRRLRRSR